MNQEKEGGGEKKSNVAKIEPEGEEKKREEKEEGEYVMLFSWLRLSVALSRGVI